MSGRRLIAGSAMALLMPASLLLLTNQPTQAAPAGSLASAAVASSSAAKATVSLRMLPGISQFGKRTASPDAAKAVASIKVAGAPAGTTVKLEAESGTSWVPAGTGKTDKQGRAVILTNLSNAGVGINYRASVGSAVSNTASTQNWLTPTFSETFDGSKLSTAWTHRVQNYNPQGARRCSKGSPQAVSVKGGAARLSVMKDPKRKGKCTAKANGKSKGKFAWRINGHISTEGSYGLKYGVASARIKMQKARGQHGGFWLQPMTSDGGTNPVTAGAEIDVIEWFGEGANKGGQTGITSFTYHKNSSGQQVKTGNWIKDPTSLLANKSDKWYTNYHVFSVEWTPSEYIFYIDGKESWRSNVGVSGTNQFLILSLLSSDYEIPNGGDKILPSHMYVDWVRAWQAPETPAAK